MRTRFFRSHLKDQNKIVAIFDKKQGRQTSQCNFDIKIKNKKELIFLVVTTFAYINKLE